MATTEITIPFNLEPHELVLDPATVERGFSSIIRSARFMSDEAGIEEIERVLTAAVCLFHAGAGTIAECLDTAIIWERG